MPSLRGRRLVACIAILSGIAPAAFAAEILIVDAKSQPESLTVAPGGVLIVGSASTPFIYKVKPGSTTVEKFVDASAEAPGTFFFGMLADAGTNTLWACQLTPVPGTTPVKRHTALRASTSLQARKSYDGSCLVTTALATISPSGLTRRFISATLPTAGSISCRLMRPPRSCFWKIVRSTESTASRF